ncbi:MAG: FecR domain-containing protein [Tannerellaceae bacterium]|nr:FecR domain-containing protein [Tannerellaceae bacterium]
MESTIFYHIIRKYLSGRFPSQTEERIQKWLINDKDTEKKEEASLVYWNQIQPESDSGTYVALERVNTRIGRFRKQPAKKTLFSKISRVAAILIPLFILAGSLHYYLTYKRMVEITVAYGEEKHIFLPDSTEVWLNAGTTIKYRDKFKGSQRLVHLDGEAYFLVVRNEEAPFIVKTADLSVKVLGTQFNVKAYPEDNKTVTTLTSGKVEVHTSLPDARILVPNEQLTYHRVSSDIEITTVQPEESYSWITGQLIFSGSSLNEIIQTLERQFNISIQNNTDIPASKIYTVKFIKNETPGEILDVLMDIAGFRYRKVDNRFILEKTKD